VAVLLPRGFSLYWGGQFVGGCGAALSGVALPLVVVTLLGATPAQAGALKAVEFGAVPAFAAIAGYLVDRFNRRRLLVASGVLRTLAIAVVPFALAAKVATLGLIFATGAAAGAATAVYDAAALALLPSLFPTTLRMANERLAMAGSMSEMFGTGVAGAIVAGLGAPLAVAWNAAAMLGSTVCVAIAQIRGAPDCARPSKPARASDGFALVFADPLLRRIICANAASHFGGAVCQSVIAIYYFRALHLNPAILGVVLAVANLGVFGARVSRCLAQKIGVRRTCALALVGRGIGNLCVPVACIVTPFAAIFVSRLILTFCGPLFEIQQQNAQLECAPDELLGSACAAVRIVVWGALPLGALAGGLGGEWFGIVPVLITGSLVSGLSSVCLVDWMRLGSDRRRFA
jgi:hypothetical protein